MAAAAFMAVYPMIRQTGPFVTARVHPFIMRSRGRAHENSATESETGLTRGRADRAGRRQLAGAREGAAGGRQGQRSGYRARGATLRAAQGAGTNQERRLGPHEVHYA